MQMQMQKNKLFTILFLLSVATSLCVSVDFVYAEEEQHYNIDDLILSANLYIDANITYKTNTYLQVTHVTSMLSAPASDDLEDAPVAPSVEEKTEKQDYSAMDLLGSQQYFVDNHTRDMQFSSATAVVTTAFSIDSYYMLYIDNMKTLDVSAGNSYVKVYYATDSSVAYTAATVVNVIDDIIVNQHDFYQDLLYQSPNVDTNKSIVRIEFQNLECDGFYIYAHPSQRHFADARDMTLWWNNYDSPLAAQQAQPLPFNDKYTIRFSATHDNDFSTFQAQDVNDLNYSKMLQVSDPGYDKEADMNVKIWGWTDPEQIEESLFLDWAEQKGIDVDDIVDYQILTAHWGFVLSDTALALIKEKLQENLQTTDDYKQLVYNTLKETFPLVGITNVAEPEEFIKEIKQGYTTCGFFDSVQDTFKSIGTGITSTVTKVANTIPKTIEAIGSAAGEIISPVAQTVKTVSSNYAGAVSNVANTAGNMITNTAGHLVNGVTGVAGAASNLGSNVMKSLKLPLIVVGGILAIGVIIYVMTMMRPRL